MKDDPRPGLDEPKTEKRRRRYEPPAIRREEEFERVAATCNFFSGPPRGTCTTGGSS